MSSLETDCGKTLVCVRVLCALPHKAKQTHAQTHTKNVSYPFISIVFHFLPSSEKNSKSHVVGM